MMYAGTLLVGIIVGYALCYLGSSTTHTIKQDDSDILVKRSKPSLRSPLRTHRTHYDKYKTKDSGLYAPVTARNDKKDEVEIGQ